jgi:hypothetical protein
MAKNQGKLAGKENQIIHEYSTLEWSTTKLAKIHQVSDNSILQMLKKHNVPIRPRKITSKEMKERCIERYKTGLSLEAAGKPDGLSAAAVLMYMEEYNVPTRSAEEAHRKYPINEDFFDNIDTEEKAYFLGFLYADGCNQMAHHWSTVISLDVIDEEILHVFSKLIYKDENDAKSQVRLSNREHEGKGIEATLSINSKHICQQMQKLGCVSRKTFILEYPKWMPENLHRHFIRGYFDGDGTINRETEMVSGCKIVSTLQFLEGMKTIANIDCSIYKVDKSNDKNTYELYYSGNRNQWLFLHWVYSGATIYLQRKYDAYLRFSEKMRIIDEKTQAGTQGYRKSNLPKTSSLKF